ncbi:hypothetical protein GCM10022215_29880 [Nocardioides fonticola]|uniref:NlpC/P60 domain-containing protein n=1 Tax=Nocardioides fonticola TaxID=450363 RepID=A0ABP7XQ26_9ACTN
MSRVDQTILAGDPKRLGNCVAACVATYFGIPLDAVPHFIEYDGGATTDGSEGSTGWWYMLLGFMASRGLWVVELDEVTDAEPGEVVFVAGMSERGVHHQVLYRDGVLWHDPHPSRAGVLDVREVLAWRPARHDHQPTPFACPSATGPGPCLNTTPHDAPRGCVHHSTSGVPDRHQKGDDE